MKWRIRKKAYDCAHHVSEDFLVTDDPYPIHETDNYCKLGKFSNTWLAPEKKVNPCEHCKRFCASRPMIRKRRERRVFFKEVERDWHRNYRAAVRAGVAQKDNGVTNWDLIL